MIVLVLVLVILQKERQKQDGVAIGKIVGLMVFRNGRGLIVKRQLVPEWSSCLLLG